VRPSVGNSVVAGDKQVASGARGGGLSTKEKDGRRRPEGSGTAAQRKRGITRKKMRGSCDRSLWCDLSRDGVTCHAIV
jgi:hypothetical protein